MTFQPDGEPRIPNQTPIPGPGGDQIPPGRPGDPGAQVQPSGQPSTADPQFNRAIVRATIINGVVLVAAIVLAYIVPITDDPTQATFIVISAALFSGVHLLIVVRSHQRRRREQGLTTGTQPMTSTYGQVQPAADAHPYGAVQAASAGEFVMTVEGVFTITGRGTVASGRVESGQLRPGQFVVIQRGTEMLGEVEVAGIEMIRRMAGAAAAGDSVGVLLKGVSRDDVRSGDRLIA